MTRHKGTVLASICALLWAGSASLLGQTPGATVNGLEVNNFLKLNGTSTPLLLNGSAGTSGQLLVSSGSGATPVWQSPSALGLVSGSGAANQVAFWTGTNALGGSANFTWDGTTLGVTGNVSVSGNTTLGTGSGNSVTINAATVTAANIPGGSTATDVVVRTGTGALQYRAAAGLIGGYAWLLTGNSISGTEFLGTTNTQPLVIKTDGTERLRVTAAGQVGIGTTAPTATLHVAGTGQFDNTLTVSSGGAVITGNVSVTGNITATGDLTVEGNTTLGNAATDQVTIVAGTVTAANIPGGSAATDVVVRTGTGALQYRAAAGLIGGYAWLLTGNSISGTEFLGTTNTQPLVIKTDGTERLRVTAAGQVGIGTTAPAALLHVAGTGRFDGQLTVSSGGAAITGNSTVSGTLGVSSDVSVGGNLTVNGNTTLGAGAGNSVTITAGTVTAANLPSGTSNDFIVRGAGGVLQVRTLSGIVSGTGTANRLVRWTDPSTIGNGSLDDDGSGTLSRVGNIAINPGAGNTLSTDGNFSAAGTGTFGGQLTVSSGGAAITGNVSVTGNLSATGNGSIGGNLTVSGNTTLGDAAADIVVFNAQVNSHVVPSASATWNLGSASRLWGTVYANGIRSASDGFRLIYYPSIQKAFFDIVDPGTGNPLVTIGPATASSTLENGGVAVKDRVTGNLRAGIGWDVTTLSWAVGVGNPDNPGAPHGVQLLFNPNNNANDPRIAVFNGSTTPVFLVDKEGDVTIRGTTVSVPNIPGSSTATEVVVWNAGNLERRSASSLVSLVETDPQVGTLSNGQIAFWSGGVGGALTGDNELFWDNSNKRLGIGTNNPQTKLHVHGSAVQITNSSTGSGSGDGFIIQLNGAHAQLVQNENAEIQFRTNAGSGSDTVKMRLTADGKLLFFDPANGAQYRIDLPNNSTPSVGRIRAQGYSTYSSQRWKEDIVTLPNALETVLRLRGVSFRWKPEYGGTQDIGFIAEEVGEVLPEVVQRDPKTGEYLGMDYMRVVPVLVEALKEEHRRVEELRSEVAQLRSLVEQLVRERGERGGVGQGVEVHDAWLGQNIPNPFEGTTTIPYYIPAGVSRAELVVRDLGGRELRRIELSERGAHGQVRLEMRLLGSGTYEYALVLDGRVVATRQMTLVR